MLVVTRYRVPAAEAEEFQRLGRTALETLVGRPGCLDGNLGRSIDEPDLWVLSTSWATVGAYRRALSSAEVKIRAVPLMYRAIDEASAFEQLTTWSPERGLEDHESDLAADWPG